MTAGIRNPDQYAFDVACMCYAADPGPGKPAFSSVNASLAAGVSIEMVDRLMCYSAWCYAGTRHQQRCCLMRIARDLNLSAQVLFDAEAKYGTVA